THGILLFVLIVAFVLWTVYFSRKKTERGPTRASEAREAVTAAIVGFGLLLAAASPFFLIGISTFYKFGWATREYVTFPIPICLLWVAFGTCVRSASVRAGRAVATIAAFTLLAAFLEFQVTNYVAWQAQSIKDQSIIKKTSENPLIRGYS